MTQPRFIAFSQSQRAPHAYANYRRVPRHHHTTHARTQTRTIRQAPPPQRHVSVMARVTQNNIRKQATHGTSHTQTQHTTHKPRTPARRPAQPQPLRTAQSSLHPHRRAHATHSSAHSSDHPTCRPQKITPSHTRGLRTTLTKVEGCSASTGCCRRVGCCTSTRSCRTHEQPSRHTMAPDAEADPSEHASAKRIASIKSSQIKDSQRTACYRSRTTPCASGPKTTQPDSPQVPDAVIPPHKPATP
jgi:hypothetical protein